MRVKLERGDVKDEHLYMAGAYGLGATLTHSIIGQLLISFAYAIVFVFQVRERHSRHNAQHLHHVND